MEKVEIIPWQGKYKGALLMNTCTIDVGLQILTFLTNCNPELKIFMEELHKPKIEILIQRLNLINAKHFDEASGIWVEDILHIPSSLSTSGIKRYDIWGSESNHFLVHLADIQAGSYTSICKNPLCPRMKTVRKSKEITLKYVLSFIFIILLIFES